MRDQLPEGWATTTLGEICSKPQYGWTSRAANNGKLKYVRTTDISSGRIDWASVPYCEEAPDDIQEHFIRGVPPDASHGRRLRPKTS
jgi:type I restriction enzyme S subunit